MDNTRFIDLQIDGIHIKYLSLDGNPPDGETYERMHQAIHSKQSAKTHGKATWKKLSERIPHAA